MCCCVMFSKGHSESIRRAAVAGMWYPSDRAALEQQIDQFLKEAQPPRLDGRVWGLVCPHAGYVYSGSVAAHAYSLIRNTSYDLVILIGNAHRSGFSGAAIDSSDFYQTPLGDVPVDTEFSRSLVSEDHDVRLSSKPHESDHTLEAQVPFIQRVLKPGYKIVPILFGYTPGKAFDSLVREIPEKAAGKRVLLIASTDLTHFPSYEDSKRIDARTLAAIESMDPSELDRIEAEETAKSTRNLECVLCGNHATKAVMLISRQLGACSARILKQASSGDVARGDRSRVVGYGAVALFDRRNESVAADASESSKRLSELDQRFALRIVRQVIDHYIRKGQMPDLPAPPKSFLDKRGVFVTLHHRGDLRGCIGYIEPRESLWDALVENAINSSTRDPRFARVTPDELDAISIEVSVLTPPVSVNSYTDIVIGKHGVILSKSGRSAVFLPQVAPEQGWGIEETLDHLAMKAGLSRNAWRSGTEFKVFEADVFSEDELGRQYP